jgi:phage portal protein BeeE
VRRSAVVGTTGGAPQIEDIMGIFTRRENKAQISPVGTVQKAAAVGGTNLYQPQMAGPNLVGQYYTYVEGEARNRAMQVPAISRARDLHASVISAMPLKMYRERWNDTDREMVYDDLAPRSWLRRPDPAIPYETLMAWTFDDLFFFGRAFWYITSRTQDGYPASFTRLPAGSITTEDQSGPVWYAPSNAVYFQGGAIDPDLLVQFISPLQGVIYSSEQAIATALKIEDARYRNANTAIPSGILKQTGGEPLSANELADLAAAFNAARSSNQTAALNEFLSYEATTATPDKMLLIESAQFSALQMAQICNIPPYLLGVPTGSYAYTNSRESRWDLWLYGTKTYAECITSTLSGNAFLPNGTYVEFDTDEYLGEIDDANMTREDVTVQENTQENIR